MAGVMAFGLGYEPTTDLTDRLAKSTESRQDLTERRSSQKTLRAS